MSPLPEKGERAEKRGFAAELSQRVRRETGDWTASPLSLFPLSSFSPEREEERAGFCAFCRLIPRIRRAPAALGQPLSPLCGEKELGFVSFAALFAGPRLR